MGWTRSGGIHPRGSNRSDRSRKNRGHSCAPTRASAGGIGRLWTDRAGGGRPRDRSSAASAVRRARPRRDRPRRDRAARVRAPRRRADRDADALLRAPYPALRKKKTASRTRGRCAARRRGRDASPRARATRSTPRGCRHRIVARRTTRARRASGDARVPGGRASSPPSCFTCAERYFLRIEVAGDAPRRGRRRSEACEPSARTR